MSATRHRKAFKLAAVGALVTVTIVVSFFSLRINPQATEAQNAPAPTIAEAEDRMPRLAGVPGMLSDPERRSVMVVLGDSTGNGPDEWVALMAQNLAKDLGRRVEFVNYNPQAERYAQPRVYGPDTESLVIYNVGIAGATTAEMTQVLETVLPENPEMIITSVGHNQLPLEVGRDMDLFRDAIVEQWPNAQLATIAQNPALEERAARQDKTVGNIKAWAYTRSVPIIEVYGLIKSHTDYADLYTDIIHVGPEGAALWAQTVEDQLLAPNG